MFTTLLESRAIHTRRRGGTTFSAIIHGALIAIGVVLTSRREKPPEPPPSPVMVPVFTPMAPRPVPVVPPLTHVENTAPVAPRRIDLVVTVPTITPTSLPPITFGPEIPPERIGIGGLPSAGGPSASPISSGEAIEAALVERAPSIIGTPRSPRYPSILRETGTNGQVILRFVIDTLGHAEMGDIGVVESSHALFTEAVKAVLGEYRFSPGEVGGHKVRTLVQMPFSFTVK